MGERKKWGIRKHAHPLPLYSYYDGSVDGVFDISGAKRHTRDDAYKAMHAYAQDGGQRLADATGDPQAAVERPDGLAVAIVSVDSDGEPIADAYVPIIEIFDIDAEALRAGDPTLN